MHTWLTQIKNILLKYLNGSIYKKSSKEIYYNNYLESIQEWIKISEE